MRARKRRDVYIDIVIIGLAILGIMFLDAVTNTAKAQNPNTYIPPQAFDYRDQLYKQIAETMPNIPTYNYVPALIEHESCISLKHSRCWTATSELKNSREHSIGFFQIARAFNPDGSTRMDTLQTLKNRYKESLSGTTWDNLKHRPDKQIFAGVNLINDNWKLFYMIKDPWERLAFTDNAYNGGYGWVSKERRQCGLTKGCNPDIWFGNVEDVCLRSKKVIPAYKRSICDISRMHTRDVMYTRLPKYEKQYFNEEYMNKGKQNGKSNKR